MNRIAGGALVPYKSMIGDILNILTDVNTLEGALRFFNMDSHLKLLDLSLEKLRRHMQSKEAYEEYLNIFDKRLKKLSLKYHPDKVTNRGGSNEEIAIAYNLQITLNAMRKIFIVLNETFLENINMDTRFSHYAKLNISSLGKECDIKNWVYEFFLKISSISEIKAQKVIPEIRKFLTESDTCIAHFLGNNISEFKRCRKLALVHLENFIKEYDNLLAEITNVEKKCQDENMDFIYDSIQEMRREHDNNIGNLKAIKAIAEIPSIETYEFYENDINFDGYYVSPIAIYTNVMTMCSFMINTSRRVQEDPCCTTPEDPVYYDVSSPLLYMHCLTEYYRGRHTVVYGKMVKSLFGEMIPITDESIGTVFRYHLSNVKNYLDDNCRISYYHIENFERYDVVVERRKCMQMVSELKAREEELKIENKRLSRRNQDLEEKYDRAVKQIEEFYV